MKLHLPEANLDIRVGVRHTTVASPINDTYLRRATQAWAEIGEEKFAVEAVCHLGDNFCKKTGRKVAANRLLAKLQHLSKKDRKAIFEAICPEYKSSAPNTP